MKNKNVNIKTPANSLNFNKSGILENIETDNYMKYKEWIKNNKSLLNLNEHLARVNAKSANLLTELESKNEELVKLNNKLAEANALSAELMSEISEKNDNLTQTNKNLAKANAHAAELMAVIELKDEEILKLNESLANVNARSANLVARRELQMVKIKELNRELEYEIEERQKTEESLKKSNNTKDRFFSIIAHDLRNPFISIVSLIALLNDQSDSFSKEEILELLKDLYNEALNTQTLLENLLEWSKTQTGKLHVDPKEYYLASLVNETIPVFNNHAASKGISIKTNISKEIEILGDKNIITTVIRNLLSNAIKFSKMNSEIFINAENNNGQVKLSIKDNGVGISSRKMEKLFRIDNKITSIGTANEKGSGLGLILCKEFVEKNGGDIYVESTLGEGSTFSFTMKNANGKH